MNTTTNATNTTTANTDIHDASKVTNALDCLENEVCAFIPILGNYWQIIKLHVTDKTTVDGSRIYEPADKNSTDVIEQAGYGKTLFAESANFEGTMMVYFYMFDDETMEDELIYKGIVPATKYHCQTEQN